MPKLKRDRLKLYRWKIRYSGSLSEDWFTQSPKLSAAARAAILACLKLGEPIPDEDTQNYFAEYLAYRASDGKVKVADLWYRRRRSSSFDGFGVFPVDNPTKDLAIKVDGTDDDSGWVAMDFYQPAQEAPVPAGPGRAKILATIRGFDYDVTFAGDSKRVLKGTLLHPDDNKIKVGTAILELELVDEDEDDDQDEDGGGQRTVVAPSTEPTAPVGTVTHNAGQQSATSSVKRVKAKRVEGTRVARIARKPH
jgi:hypothetical protein